MYTLYLLEMQYYLPINSIIEIYVKWEEKAVERGSISREGWLAERLKQAGLEGEEAVERALSREARESSRSPTLPVLHWRLCLQMQSVQKREREYINLGLHLHIEGSTALMQ